MQDGECINNCDSGSYKCEVDNECRPDDLSCKEFFVGDDNTYQECYDNTYLENHDCKPESGESEVNEDNNKIECKPYDTTCAECDDKLDTDCTKCEGLRYL